MPLAAWFVFAHVAAAVILGWAYFRRYRVTRPPIGVLGIGDVAFMLGAIVFVPVLYLAMPVSLVFGFLGVVTLSALYLACEPVLAAAWVVWLVTLALAAADIISALLLGANSSVSFAVNNLVIVLAAVGVTNLWAQSGMRARDAVVLGLGLVVYDFVATSQLPLMGDLFARLEGLPFTPHLAWPVAGDGWRAIGLDDPLLATVFPLVMRKAFGRSAGLLAMVLGLGAIGALLALPLATIFPVMVVLGPLMLAQYVYWSRRYRVERTTWQYLQAEPLARPNNPPCSANATRRGR